MIEVFKTNVQEQQHAAAIVNEIHKHLGHCHANFDLQDCDNILRVKSASGEVPVNTLFEILNRYGCRAEILSEEVPVLDFRL